MALKTKNAGDEYYLAREPQGYVDNREITNLEGQFLVNGSQNTLVVNKEKTVSRMGYILKGAANTENSGIKSKYDWSTSSGVDRNLRSYGDELEVWYDSAWRRVANGFPNVRFNYTEWWSSAELLDLLLFVNGSDIVREWSGGITKIASATANTLVKQGYYSNDKISFSDNGVDADTITDQDSGFVTAGFQSGDVITISGAGTPSNNKEVTIDTVTAGTITLLTTNSIDTEAFGATVVIARSGTGAWAEERFLTAGTRQVTINGDTFSYTGGEDTGTLTGVSPSPLGVVSNGDIAIQTVRENEIAALDGYSIDLIKTLNNHVYYFSLTSRIGYISKNTSFIDVSYTTPLRVPGEGFLLTLDSTPTALIPDEDFMYISAGKDDFYRVRQEFTSDQSGESIVVEKLKTANGQAAINQASVLNIKNAIAFLSVEKTFDTLGRVENIDTPQSKPISDPIKNLIESYDHTNASGLYFRRNIYLLFPAESRMLIYDMQYGYWQPPQVYNFSFLSVIDDQLIGHSNSVNESYILNSGYNDNGANIDFVAAFGYENYGSRFWEKTFDNLVCELYLTKNTKVIDQVNYDFGGSTDVREFEIDGSDEDRLFVAKDTATLGSNPLGTNPLGSTQQNLNPLSKMRVIHETTKINFFERQRVFSSSGIEARFEILAYGENVEMSEDEPTFIRK